MVQKPETVKQVYYIFLGKHSGVLSQHKHIGWRIPVLQDVQTSQSSRVLCSAPRGSAQLPAALQAQTQQRQHPSEGSCLQHLITTEHCMGCLRSRKAQCGSPSVQTGPPQQGFLALSPDLLAPLYNAVQPTQLTILSSHALSANHSHSAAVSLSPWDA